MATALPSSYTYELLSRLPPNSFSMVWKEIMPDQVPLLNKWTLGPTSDRISFVIRGAPNEFLLNTNVYLAGSAWLQAKKTDLTTDPVTVAEVSQYLQNPFRMCLNAPIHYFDRSRESFNSGSLPSLENSNPGRSHVYNVLRYTLARRNRSSSGQKLYDLPSFLSQTNNLNSNQLSSDDVRVTALPVRVLANGEADAFYDGSPAAVVAHSFGGNQDFMIPLGLYSDFVNSHSLCPVGLLSSYSVNGWQIELNTQTQSGPAGAINSFFNPPIGTGVFDNPVVYMKDLRIYVAYVRVLDPAVMEAVLSLYEKREMVNVGGVQYPLSLRMNTIGYRLSNFPLRSGQSDYFFRINSTDRSVRAMAWMVYDKTRQGVGIYSLFEPIVLTRLETNIGTEVVHQVIDDASDGNSNKVSNFVAINSAKSGAMFSPLPYYIEGRKFEGLQEMDVSMYNNNISNYDQIDDETLTTWTLINSKRSQCYGIVSFENLDRRESDHSTSFEASGKDLTNVGAIDVRMRFGVAAPPVVSTASVISALDNWSIGAITDDNHEIVFMLAYDKVLEVSPVGVTDITNAVL